MGCPKRNWTLEIGTWTIPRSAGANIFVAFDNEPMAAVRQNTGAFKRHRFMWWRHILGKLIA